MCELLVGLPALVVLGVNDMADGSLVVHVKQAGRDRRASAAASRRR
jgi:hypothetical protein